jgi:hypothetical protein
MDGNSIGADHAGRRAQAGQHAHERPEQGAHEGVAEVLQGQRGLEAQRQVGNQIHGVLLGLTA